MQASYEVARLTPTKIVDWTTVKAVYGSDDDESTSVIDSISDDASWEAGIDDIGISRAAMYRGVGGWGMIDSRLAEKANFIEDLDKIIMLGGPVGGMANKRVLAEDPWTAFDVLETRDESVLATNPVFCACRRSAFSQSSKARPQPEGAKMAQDVNYTENAGIAPRKWRLAIVLAMKLLLLAALSAIFAISIASQPVWHGTDPNKRYILALLLAVTSLLVGFV